MKKSIYSGICSHCDFIWLIFDRMPNYCPECGNTLFSSTKEFMMTSKQYAFVLEDDINYL